MTEKLNKALKLILQEEGGYVNDPIDPGKETKYGISKRQYPDLDIKNLTLAQAIAVYERDYWIPIKGDELPWPICLYVFDSAVNQGVQAAVGLLQKTLGIKRDGIMGPITVATANKYATVNVAALYLADRALRYIDTKNFERYGRGWMKRMFVMAMES
ncbi:MAG: glycoside hydrolase family 108 protein [Minisyncoccota bacterium]